LPLNSRRCAFFGDFFSARRRFWEKTTILPAARFKSRVLSFLVLIILTLFCRRQGDAKEKSVSTALRKILSALEKESEAREFFRV